MLFYCLDASGLKEPEHVRESRTQVVQALQQYTTAQYPSLPTKFGELLLRMPELHRVCQVKLCSIVVTIYIETRYNLNVHSSYHIPINNRFNLFILQVGKEMLCPRQSVNGETPGFNLLMELLRGDH